MPPDWQGQLRMGVLVSSDSPAPAVCISGGKTTSSVLPHGSPSNLSAGLCPNLGSASTYLVSRRSSGILLVVQSSREHRYPWVTAGHCRSPHKPHKCSQLAPLLPEHKQIMQKHHQKQRVQGEEFREWRWGGSCKCPTPALCSEYDPASHCSPSLSDPLVLHGEDKPCALPGLYPSTHQTSSAHPQPGATWFHPCLPFLSIAFSDHKPLCVQARQCHSSSRPPRSKPQPLLSQPWQRLEAGAPKEYSKSHV